MEAQEIIDTPSVTELESGGAGLAEELIGRRHAYSVMLLTTS